MLNWRYYLQDFVSLIYPNVCNACGRNLLRIEAVICTHCLFKLPIRDDYKNPKNKLMQQFLGRMPLQLAASYLSFNKGTRVQNLLHRLKYKNRPDIGEKLGALHAVLLQENDCFKTIDYIIPVPLHPEKERIRGYNQSRKYAEGLAQVSHKMIDDSSLLRSVATDSQTKKTRVERLDNMEGVFECINATHLEGKHILLVDDVITTGATLEACCQSLLKIPNITLSISSIAFAGR